MADTSTLVPAITEELKFRTNVKTIIGVGGVLIGAVIWCTRMYIDVQITKTAVVDNTTQINAMRQDIAQLKWALEPRAYNTKKTP